VKEIARDKRFQDTAVSLLTRGPVGTAAPLAKVTVSEETTCQLCLELQEVHPARSALRTAAEELHLPGVYPPQLLGGKTVGQGEPVLLQPEEGWPPPAR